MGQSKAENTERALALDERRAFLKLPLEERRRQMSAQAACMVAHYQEGIEAKAREEWQATDIVECS
jgi:hypothetical protein